MTQPSSTYRLQLRPGWGFDDAARIVGYLADLGVSHAYLSPVLQAVPGSEHGYDVVDPTRVDRERGGERGRAHLVATLHDAGLGVVQDIVPNHVALVTPHNRWWWDVLRSGPGSAYAAHFDIDWEAGDGRVLIPVLGSPLADELAAGTIGLDELAGEPVVRYHDHVLPLAPGTAGRDLPAVLNAQHYELAHWRRANDELNYRRFFDITTLGGVRVEDPDVFEDTHAEVLGWVADGSVVGLRVDHPDGLRDPTGYLEQLRSRAPDTWIVVEKILEPGEPRPAWPVDGTVGYAFCNQVLRLLVDPAGEPGLTELYAELTARSTDWDRIVDDAKRDVLAQLFGAELGWLDRRFSQVAEAERVDLDARARRQALIETLVSFPVYRTYVRPEAAVSDDDRSRIHATVAAVRQRCPELRPALELLERTLTLGIDRGPAVELAARFQQVSGPVMAKGVEDTAFYRHLRLVALNEVGGDPSRFAVDPDTFHAANDARLAQWPDTMLLTSTHDTKRSEDVRARLAVLSEVPDRWASTVRGWFERNRRHRDTDDQPSRNLEYLLYQTLVGAWPIGADRLLGYLEKAAREEKRDTHWHAVDADYERALAAFATRLLDDRGFVDDVGAFVASIRDAGWVNSLVQTTLKLTCPGVPDVYQGCELWDLSLVDPDNRRPVDFDTRRRLLEQLDGLDVGELWARRDDGLPKLALTRALLHLRREQADVFGRGAYEPLHVTGDRRDHVVAFARSSTVAVVVPRLTVSLGDGSGSWIWGDTRVTLPPGPWRDVVTDRGRPGGDTGMGDVLADLPVAVLARTDLA